MKLTGFRVGSSKVLYVVTTLISPVVFRMFEIQKSKHFFFTFLFALSLTNELTEKGENSLYCFTIKTFKIIDCE